MANLVFDTVLRDEFNNAMGKTGVSDKLAEGDKASPKGVKSIKEVLTNAVNFLGGLSESSNPTIKSYSEVDMGLFGRQRYEELVKSVTPGSGVALTPVETMIYAMDIERAMVSHFLTMSQDKKTIPTKVRDKAKELAVDMAKKVAVDYRNLCIIVNKPGVPETLPEVVNNVDIMDSLPTGKNLYKLYHYVDLAFDLIVSNATGAPILSDAEIDGKDLPNDSTKNIRVKALDLSQRIAPSKKLGDEYKQLFGGLNRNDKMALRGAGVAAGLVALAIGTAAVAKSCGQEPNTPEETTNTEQVTLAPEDEIINNPADDFVVPETEPETTVEGEIVTEADTHNYDKPATDRNEDKGATDDFKSPIEQGGHIITLPVEEETMVEPIEPETTVETNPTEAETESEYEEITIGNPAEGSEEPEYEGIGPNRGGSSKVEEETEEDEGPLAGRF